MTKTKKELAQAVNTAVKELEQQINDAIEAGLTVKIKAPTGFENSTACGYSIEVEIFEKVNY